MICHIYHQKEFLLNMIVNRSATFVGHFAPLPGGAPAPRGGVGINLNVMTDTDSSKTIRFFFVWYFWNFWVFCFWEFLDVLEFLE